MINYLYVKNFKCIEELRIPIVPLTLMTGFNAAGKSTVLQALLLLAQTAREGGTLEFIPLNGSLVRLGNQTEVIRHGADSAMEIGINIETHSDTNHMNWIMTTNDRRTAHALSVGSFSCNSELETYTPGDLGHSRDFYLAEHKILSEIFDQLKNIIFISAVRIGASEVYPAPDAAEPIWADVGVHGEFAAWWFEKLSDEDVDLARRHPNEFASNLRNQFNAWISALFPGAEANAQRIGGTSLVRLEFRNHETDEWRRPANIGYGLTYVFPILVAGLIAKPGQILIVDSPEAHLHPKGQSEMGKFLAMLAHSGVTVIIETHSDHVLNGVRMAVSSRKNIKPTDVAIHFFNARPRSDMDPAHVTSPEIDINGSLSEWPPGFFDQAERDLATLAGWV